MTLKNDELEKESNSHTGFLQRWSNRKIESKTTSEISLDENNISDTALAEAAVSEDEPIIHKTDEDMPPLDQLNEETNFSDFLSPNVSDALRKQALRKLFQMPFLNAFDDLDDYAEDYTKFEALGDIVPHDMKRMLEREEQKEREKQDALNNDELENEDVDIEDAENEEEVQAVNNEEDDLETSDELTNHKDKTENEKLN